ncbi:MAG TPA: hypothetical protein PLZ94_14865 [Armatimonadota bacterium]|nr:hypothetical protein [Armatimonadota bacterium]
MNPNINPEHVITLQGRQYCTYRGVLECAHAIGLEGIRTRILQVPGPDNEYVAIVEAEVHLKDGRVFVDVADASPKNVSRHLQSALIRLASTRAKGRALRDAVNIGVALAEELDEVETDPAVPAAHAARPAPAPAAPATPAPPAAPTAPAPPATPAAATPGPEPYNASKTVPPSGNGSHAPAKSQPLSPTAEEGKDEPGPTSGDRPMAFTPMPAGSAHPAPEARANELVCSSPGCGRVVTQGQYNYSMQTYGAALCPACQRKRKAQEKTS